MSRKNVVIIGASSGIGRELAKVFHVQGYRLGLAARRDGALRELQKELSSDSIIKRMDIARPDEAMRLLDQIIREMGGVDIIVLNAGTGFLNPDLAWQKEKDTIDVNVSGFAALANIAFNYFVREKSGHLVGISSIAAIRGDSFAPAYSASKAFMSNYLEALRSRVAKMNIPVTVTDIQPGYVDTAMAQGNGLFWVAPAQTAAEQIYRAIIQKRYHAYVTKRWRLIAWLLKIIPFRILAKYS